MNYEFTDNSATKQHIFQEIISGLSQPRKCIEPKYFYDDLGSQLFHEITTLEEYYPTRTEIDILETNGKAILDYLPKGTVLLEYGSGSAKKINLLVQPGSNIVKYVPIEISRNTLEEVSKEFAAEFPDLEVEAICADYNKLHRLQLGSLFEKYPRRCVFFPGSTVGNLSPENAEELFDRTRQLLAVDDFFLVGFDLVKDVDTMERAYNDSQEVTARFNMNILRRLNRELNANFDLAQFHHKAFYNTEHNRIEMHLVSRTNQIVQVGEHFFSFEENETIHTENSHKYRPVDYESLGRRTGFAIKDQWTDPQSHFSVVLFQAQALS